MEGIFVVPAETEERGAKAQRNEYRSSWRWRLVDRSAFQYWGLWDASKPRPGAQSHPGATCSLFQLHANPNKAAGKPQHSSLSRTRERAGPKLIHEGNNTFTSRIESCFGMHTYSVISFSLTYFLTHICTFSSNEFIPRPLLYFCQTENVIANTGCIFYGSIASIVAVSHYAECSSCNFTII